MQIEFSVATEEDAEELAMLRTVAAERLTDLFGPGHWSATVTATGVVGSMKHARVLVARYGTDIVGSLRLATKKPWAIDPAYFTASQRPVYLTDMAVHPDVQRRGIGRALMARAENEVRRWPGDAIRLDAYDAPAGAGDFYSKCGYREVGRVVYRSVPLIYFERVFVTT